MQADTGSQTNGQDQEFRNLSCLYEITRHLASATSLQECLEKIVQTLAELKEMDNGTISIINPTTGELEIEVAHGITAEAKRRGRYKLGEGITGKVVATGEPIIVPQIGDEPLFLNRTRTRGDERKKKSSFLCVPIIAAQQTLGALSIDRMYREGFGSESEHDMRFLTVVSGLIAETVQRIQRVNEEKEALRQENSKLRRELSAKNRIDEIIGNSSRMQEVFDMVHRVADSNATVLLRGESGTGKTLVAKALHHNSGRAAGPFVVVNCSALPESLLESELFGHEKGAFTGATETKKGRFELAEGGTLFLDEIGEISPAVQVKLLNVIQERTLQRLGSGKIIATNIRLVAATNRDLEAAVKEMAFREDLYYRLNVFPVYLPPLRERRTDVLLLAEYFLEKYAQENNKQIKRISTPAIDLLVQYHWPGNVRELQNCMERAVLICDGSAIMSIHLPPSLQSPDSLQTDKPLSLATAVENFERELIVEALKKSNGNQTKAAKILATSLRIINYKIHNYGIEPKHFKVK
ncbi:sigma 54-interacting transcriptional regulator [Desulfobulbus alkaliphilus]|uniref:sigma 54-interacting transcriptional regulator n=1 Tax=Desulfobulbus alkaliphilus TaxID=869814 RepID=UPI001966A92A|nr:sigma 54-interacting transcriptional regulator [Desulfobulbus alkaliphilus]MBM9536752.1 sigma 54-interacting transcriptional regulator [Desulfobulbus alkaliphilus]